MIRHLLALFTALLLATATFAVYRLSQTLDPRRPKPKRSPGAPAHLLIVLGSGGHTAEMIAMLTRAVTGAADSPALDWQRFSHRTWVVSSGDSISAERAEQFEKTAAANATAGKGGTPLHSYTIHVVPRAREIHQPAWTAPWSCLRCLWACVQVLLGSEGGIGCPDLILCNGPATATIAVLTSVLLRFFNVQRCASRGLMRTVYVESWARVQKLSLSGLLLSRIVDRFLVQWPQLEKTSSRAEFAGVLV